MVAWHYGLTPMQGRILRVLWRAQGYVIPSERIFQAMYEDDPDGGPSWEKMYLGLKVALSRMRNALRGSGIIIETVGREGYRLTKQKERIYAEAV
jgi:DNA-binding winged helix-turn-helix (wHTH) protein